MGSSIQSTSLRQMHPLIWRNTCKLETWEVSVNLFLAVDYFETSDRCLMLPQLDCAIRRYSTNLRCYPPLITSILCIQQATLFSHLSQGKQHQLKFPI